MKKTVLTLVIGIIIGSSLGLVAYGATQQTVEAVFMDIKYLLNGEVVEFENKPLVYNQTTYVPIREAANLLGLEVDWDQERQMVVLNSVEKSNDKGMINKPMNDLLSNNEYQNNNISIKLSSVITVEPDEITKAVKPNVTEVVHVTIDLSLIGKENLSGLIMDMLYIYDDGTTTVGDVTGTQLSGEEKSYHLTNYNTLGKKITEIQIKNKLLPSEGITFNLIN